MGKRGSLSGGGIEGNKVSQTRAPKQEPKPQGVSIGATSRIGGALAVGTTHKALYNQVAYTNPVGTNHNFEVGPGAGRVVLKSGSQSKTPSPTPMSGPRRSLFK